MTEDWDISEFLNSFTVEGYSFDSIASGESSKLLPQNTIYLRHDVDFSIAAALEMAEKLYLEGIRSCFFLMLTTPLYNLMDASGRRAINELIRMNHDIRLHFDPTVYREREINSGLHFELGILEALSSQPQNLISFHRPAQDVIRSQRSYFGVEHTYMSKYMSEIQYFSDSRGEFRFGHPRDSEEFHMKKSMQILLHPEWWFCSGTNSLERVTAALDGCKDSLDQWAAANCALLSST